ncbi:two-component sensor histidine kinase [Helicobacter aurati]|uniref:histidine kinase n=1 Tax=Helicobacter aurati TaxID=137778 RepID=A0A3D8JA88_9HELI|nr:HAMP domain-containing sensor histidine kinase [Helicobacter aurati]RDU73821.1 two-component sensor histidine kinase [Helicobacter aurati]
MRKKIFLSIFLTALTTIVLANSCFIVLMQSLQHKQKLNELRNYAQSLESSLALLTKQHLQTYPYYITLITQEGEILYDNTMSCSHTLGIKEAFKEGESYTTSYCEALQTTMIHLAYKTTFNHVQAVLKISMPIYNLLDFPTMLYLLLAEFCLCAILSYAMAHILTRKILAPLESMTLTNFLEYATYTEFKPLIQQIKNKYQIITNQLKGLKQNQNQVLLLAQNMSDGLIFLNKMGKVLLINEQAKKYFPDIIASKAVRKCKDNVFIQRVIFALNEYKKHKRKENESYTMIDKECEVLFCPVYSKDKLKGMIIILRDMDAKLKAQKLRKEFSANVTHELKTPLTSILTSSEMLQNKLVAREDFPHFVTVIQKEAKRLLEMIDEIFKLSFLDEKHPIPITRINLQPIAQKAFESLKIIAQNKQIRFYTHLQECFVMGNAELLNNLITNLCDNAIKYNKAGGYVHLQLKHEGTQVVLIVEDNGMGIPKNLHERIFERFFCVDKSRSKKLGGTGLGLSIVKSVAKFHNANIRLTSAPGEGSRFYITFTRV